MRVVVIVVVVFIIIIIILLLLLLSSSHSFFLIVCARAHTQVIYSNLRIWRRSSTSVASARAASGATALSAHGPLDDVAPADDALAGELAPLLSRDLSRRAPAYVRALERLRSLAPTCDERIRMRAFGGADRAVARAATTPRLAARTKWWRPATCRAK